METIVKHAQGLVYSLLSLMPSSGCYWTLKGIPYLTIPQSNQPVR